jgi:hypothetical protein
MPVDFPAGPAPPVSTGLLATAFALVKVPEATPCALWVPSTAYDVAIPLFSSRENGVVRAQLEDPHPLTLRLTPPRLTL